MIPQVATISAKSQETADTVTVALQPPEGKFHFEPGQFNMLYAFGIGEIPISMSGSPSSSEVITHTVRSVGAVSRGLTRLEVGQAVGVRGPFGSCWPLAEAKGKDVVIIAGGLGVAPLRPLIYEILKERKLYQRVSLLYGARSPGDLLFSHEHDSWRDSDIELRITVDFATANWLGEVGVVTTLLDRLQITPEQTSAFVCGPDVMMRQVLQRLLDSGIAADDLFLSLERNMKCAIGFCGHCQFGGEFVCKDGPVFPFAKLQRFWSIREY